MALKMYQCSFAAELQKSVSGAAAAAHIAAEKGFGLKLLLGHCSLCCR